MGAIGVPTGYACVGVVYYSCTHTHPLRQDRQGSGQNAVHLNGARLKRKEKKKVMCSIILSFPFSLTQLILWHRMWGWGKGWIVSLRASFYFLFSLSFVHLCVLIVYFESLLITRMSAPFSSFSLWLSTFKSPNTCKHKTQRGGRGGEGNPTKVGADV